MPEISDNGEERKGSKSRKATWCSITFEQFVKHAKPMKVILSGNSSVPIPLGAEPRIFSTGSFGWMVPAKIQLEIDGVAVLAQVCLNIVVVGSKQARKEFDDLQKRKEV